MGEKPCNKGRLEKTEEGGLELIEELDVYNEREATKARVLKKERGWVKKLRPA